MKEVGAEKQPETVPDKNWSVFCIGKAKVLLWPCNHQPLSCFYIKHVEIEGAVTSHRK
jgi:hypothetical protein